MVFCSAWREEGWVGRELSLEGGAGSQGRALLEGRQHSHPRGDTWWHSTRRFGNNACVLSAYSLVSKPSSDSDLVKPTRVNSAVRMQCFTAQLQLFLGIFCDVCRAVALWSLSQV